MRRAMLVDFKRLRNFREVAALGSLSRASQQLRLAQPALSRQISLLEHEIGLPLFTRHGRGMQLTEAGAALLARIEGPLRQLERAADEVRAQSGIVSGQAAIGMMPTVAAVLGGDLLQQMSELYPKVAFRIAEGYDGYLMDWLQRGTIDATLLYGPVSDRHLRVQPLFVEELRVVARMDRLGKSPISLAEVAKQPLILPSRLHGLRKIVEAAFHVAHIPLDVRFEVDSYSMLTDLVRRGVGCAILPRSGIASEQTDEQIVSATLVPALRRQVVLALRPGPEPDRATRTTLNLLDDIVALRAAAGAWVYSGTEEAR